MPSSKEAPKIKNRTIVTTFSIANQYSNVPKFETLLAFLFGIIERHRDRRRRTDQRQYFQEAGKIVDDETAAEGRELAGRQHDQRDAGDGEKHDSDDIDDASTGLAAKHAEHQQRHSADAEHELGKERNKRGELSGVHSLIFTSAPE